ncbi:MAG: 4-(cytidine 5'-diphospho)-2-C-methyl-D-erythritol kinase [Terricaulis sp.]
MSVRIFAPAKINLTLRVGRPRADGLHPLQSVVMFADVGDWIEALPAHDLSLDIRGPFASELIADDSNLVLRAARVLALAASVAPRAKLVLEKNLPIASGMGGGSSDAAATLKALNVLWELGFAEAELARIACDIGADVPVCVVGRSSWMTGLGETLAPMQAPVLHAVLANPLRPLATAAVFREFDRMRLARALSESSAPVWRTPAEMWVGAAMMGNDLAAPARALMPEIAEIEALLHAHPRVVHAGLSGSGATVFGLVETREAAEAVAADLAHSVRWIRAAVLGA